MHEYTLADASNFGVDHFEPKSKAHLLECAYKNLYYSCNICNRIKRDTWPTNAQIAQGFRFVDVCSEVIYGKHLRCKFDGTLEALTKAGEYTEERIDLNRPDLKELRKDRNEAMHEIRELRRFLRGSPSLPEEVLNALRALMEKSIRRFLSPPTPPGRKQLRQKREEHS